MTAPFLEAVHDGRSEDIKRSIERKGNLSIFDVAVDYGVQAEFCGCLTYVLQSGFPSCYKSERKMSATKISALLFSEWKTFLPQRCIFQILVIEPAPDYIECL
jgi:hypothetical protein